MPKAKRERKERRERVEKITSVKIGQIDYKNPILLSKFLSSRKKILPRKVSGLSAMAQRKLGDEIKKARIMGLLPFTDRHALS